MRHTRYNVFFAWDYENEEKWLNEMSAAGMQLVGVGCCKYIFEDGEPGEYNYRIEMLKDMPSNPKSIAYIRFLEESGAEHVGSFFRWVYMRRKASMGAFELFSDIDSRTGHLKRVLTLFLCLLPLEIGALCSNVANMINGYRFNLFMAVLLGCIVGLFIMGITKLALKIHRLKKERILRE